ncbi:MAG: hypothetical protein H5T75_00385 [Coriobacteriia bacterium]|nr:hypothetical protein [Coriobacteriia bacterium]MDI6843148.1 lysoplasmalogenase family protein [Anaerosomatales bacterium]
MTPFSAVGVALTVAGTVAALVAARAKRPFAYGAAKTAASAGFVVVALGSAGRAHGGLPSALVLAGLVTAAVSDVALAFPGRKGLVAGLGGFALAHALAGSGFAIRAGFAWLALGVLLGAIGGAAVRRWLRERVKGALGVAAGMYTCVALAMATGACGAGAATHAWQLGAGAALVVGSDLAVAAERFFGHGIRAKAVGLPAYYAGQLLVAFGIAAL